MCLRHAPNVYETSIIMNTSLTLCVYNICFPNRHNLRDYQSLTKAFKGGLHNPMSNVSDKFSGTLSLLMFSILGLVCVVLKCLKELQQCGLLVATRFICTYVQNRHTMKKSCKKISIYLHTMYIPQSLVIKHAC